MWADTDIRLMVKTTAQSVRNINPLAAKLFNWNFHPLEVVSR